MAWSNSEQLLLLLDRGALGTANLLIGESKTGSSRFPLLGKLGPYFLGLGCELVYPFFK